MVDTFGWIKLPHCPFTWLNLVFRCSAWNCVAVTVSGFIKTSTDSIFNWIFDSKRGFSFVVEFSITHRHNERLYDSLHTNCCGLLESATAAAGPDVLSVTCSFGSFLWYYFFLVNAHILQSYLEKDPSPKISGMQVLRRYLSQVKVVFLHSISVVSSIVITILFSCVYSFLEWSQIQTDSLSFIN